ncbi:hypothetical protein yberc0001_34010 [Yersinia bercovieri ATCC 43970]|uniref:Uncharacterized protein n=1 Tax=Yersinia bercovieri ATCC 43970 TaxID=349968 RepID=A0ABM9XTX2_YERBE|nr:hypothetical protein yberc0001_34010 [Yersinia bercovieri ATCC 43970]
MKLVARIGISRRFSLYLTMLGRNLSRHKMNGSNYYFDYYL